MRNAYDSNQMTKKQKIIWCINEIIYLVFNVDFNEYKPTKLWNALTVVALTWQLEKLFTNNGITKQNPTLIDVGYVSLVVIDLPQENIQSLILSPLVSRAILKW